MRISAEKLTDQGVELPIPEPTFLQKLKGTYLHSYDTLKDFDTDMKPILAELRTDIEQAEQAKVNEYQKRMKEEKYERTAQAEEAKRKAEHELEVEKRMKARLWQEKHWTDDPESTNKKDRRSDLDLKNRS